MSLYTMRPLLEHARQNGYAVGAFNVDNLETMDAVARAAEAEKAPVIFAIGPGGLRYTRLPYLAALALKIAESISVPAAVHLDHGPSVQQAADCVANGFTSVMIDASAHPIDENIRQTRQVVELAHEKSVSVEAELGRIGGREDTVSCARQALTDVDEAVRFVRETDVDALAVAIGTCHGLYKWKPELDFERLRQLAEVIPIPLVMHGGSDLPDDDVRKAIELGISKVNVCTELRLAFLSGLTRQLEDPAVNQDMFKVLAPARDAITELVRKKMRVFGCSGRAERGV